MTWARARAQVNTWSVGTSKPHKQQRDGGDWCVCCRCGQVQGLVSNGLQLKLAEGSICMMMVVSGVVRTALDLVGHVGSRDPEQNRTEHGGTHETRKRWWGI